MQGNRGHIARCVQHHWSQPQESLTDQVSQFLSFLLPLLQQDKTLKWIVLSLIISLLHRWEKDADRVLPPLQRGLDLYSPSRSVYQWIDWTYQLQVVLKLVGDLYSQFNPRVPNVFKLVQFSFTRQNKPVAVMLFSVQSHTSLITLILWYSWT